jgi:hypothetical protein
MRYTVGIEVIKVIQRAIENYEGGVVYSLDDWLELKDEYYVSYLGFLNKNYKEENEDE